ncbi:UNVERIFIED_CONTAM: AMP-binding protein [Mycobacterium avium subsp. hominissuis]
MVTAIHGNRWASLIGDDQRRTIGDLLEDTRHCRGNALAVVQGETQLTYQELFVMSCAIAGRLAQCGISRGSVVTFQLPNWWETVVLFHGCVRIGAAANPVVPIYRERELGFILRQSTPAVVVIPHRFRGFDFVKMLHPVLATLSKRPTVVVVRPQGPLPSRWLTFDDLLAGPGALNQTVDPSDIALLMYTSGTTADPKGAMHSHETLVYENHSIAELFDIGPQDCVFMPSPLAHITGLLYGIVLPAMIGIPTVLLDVWDRTTGADMIERDRCTFTVGATPFLQGLVDVYEDRGHVSALRVFLCGGADVPPQLIRRARASLDAVVVRVYGSTEFPTFSCGRPGDTLDVAANTDGTAIGCSQARLVDVDHGVGELVVGGPEMFLGYLDERLNADAFTSDGFFRTGDLATIGDDGAITIRGRKKDIIIRGGENISAKEIEDLLFEHPGIAEAAAVAMPDAAMGEKVCAFVVPADSAPLALSDITTYLTGRGIARQKLPERLQLVAELPKTASGKVQKFILRDQIRAALDAEGR